eukprot:Skav202006  [mRNA]  locus=scaffold1829:7712:11195:- [translate_table: standard]
MKATWGNEQWKQLGTSSPLFQEPQLQQLRKIAPKSLGAQRDGPPGEYSMLAYAIAEGEYSGEGDDRSYFGIVFYEPSKKSKVVVDPDSKMEQEAWQIPGESKTFPCLR